MTFGERLKKLRQERELTQGQIGELLGVGSRMISFYESDTHFPRDAESLIRLARYFDVSLDYLLGVTSIRNYDDFLTSHKIYKLLPEKGRQEADEYFLYLKYKYRVK